MKIVVTFNNQEYEGEFTESRALMSALANMLVEIMNQTKLLRPTGLDKDFAAIEKEGAIFLQYGEKSHHCLRIDDKLKPDFQDQLEYWFRSHLEGGAKYGPGIKVSHDASKIKCDLTDLIKFEMPLEEKEAIVAIIVKCYPTIAVVKKVTSTSSDSQEKERQQNAIVFGQSVTSGASGAEDLSELAVSKNG